MINDYYKKTFDKLRQEWRNANNDDIIINHFKVSAWVNLLKQLREIKHNR